MSAETRTLQSGECGHVVQYEVIHERAKTFKEYETLFEKPPRDFTTIEQAAKELGVHTKKWEYLDEFTTSQTVRHP